MEPASLQLIFKEEAIKWAEAHIRYLHRGFSKLGCDCTGLIIGIARSIGYLGKYDLRNYSPDWNLHSKAGNYIIEELEKVANEIPKSEIEEGDILVFSLGRCLAHVGILVKKDNGKFVHSLVSSKRCEYGILKNSGWGFRWKKVYRMNAEKMKRFC